MSDVLFHVSLYLCFKMKEDADQVTIATELRLLLLTCCDTGFRHNRHHIQKNKVKRSVTPIFVSTFASKVINETFLIN